jgi:hypothetical protein
MKKTRSPFNRYVQRYACGLVEGKLNGKRFNLCVGYKSEQLFFAFALKSYRYREKKSKIYIFNYYFVESKVKNICCREFFPKYARLKYFPFLRKLAINLVNFARPL